MQVTFCTENACLVGPTAPSHLTPPCTVAELENSQDPGHPSPARTERSLSPDRNLERMIWERWEEAARVIAKAGMGTWTGGEGRAPTGGSVRLEVRRLPLHMSAAREGPKGPRDRRGLGP